MDESPHIGKQRAISPRCGGRFYFFMPRFSSSSLRIVCHCLYCVGLRIDFTSGSVCECTCCSFAFFSEGDKFGSCMIAWTFGFSALSIGASCDSCCGLRFRTCASASALSCPGAGVCSCVLAIAKDERARPRVASVNTRCFTRFPPSALLLAFRNLKRKGLCSNAKREPGYDILVTLTGCGR